MATRCLAVVQGHHPVLATFRSLVSGHKADGKRWVGCPNSCAGAAVDPLASPGWFCAFGLGTSLQWLLRNIIRLLAGWSFVRNGPQK